MCTFKNLEEIWKTWNNFEKTSQKQTLDDADQFSCLKKKLLLFENNYL